MLQWCAFWAKISLEGTLISIYSLMFIYTHISLSLCPLLMPLNTMTSTAPIGSNVIDTSHNEIQWNSTNYNFSNTTHIIHTKTPKMMLPVVIYIANTHMHKWLPEKEQTAQVLEPYSCGWWRVPGENNELWATTIDMQSPITGRSTSYDRVT